MTATAKLPTAYMKGGGVGSVGSGITANSVTIPPPATPCHRCERFVPIPDTGGVGYCLFRPSWPRDASKPPRFVRMSESCPEWKGATS